MHTFCQWHCQTHFLFTENACYVPLPFLLTMAPNVELRRQVESTGATTPLAVSPHATLHSSPYKTACIFC